MADRPAPELAIDEHLVATLIKAQHPELSRLPLAPLARGWDNTSYRLGTDHIVRLPHRQVADVLIVNEQRWLGLLAARLDLAIPAPTHLGVPSAAYPWHWSVVPWFEGTEAAGSTLGDPAGTAERLGRFFLQLHRPAPPDAPTNPFRGCPLADRADRFHADLTRLAHARGEKIEALFSDAAKVVDSPRRVWLHGDLHTRNLIVRDGELVAAIDWGDVCAGDPATDLAAAFMLVPDELATVQQHAGASEAEWERARGWAVYFAVMYLVNSDDDPVMAAIGGRLLTTLLP